MSPLGDVWRIPPGSTQPQPFGHVNGITPGADFGLLGLAVDVFGNVYGAVQSANPAANGVWRFDRTTGAATRLPGTAAIGLAERSRVRQADEPVRDRLGARRHLADPVGRHRIDLAPGHRADR